MLKVLDIVLRSNDITMTESSLPTFQAFCEHHDASSLLANSAYLQQYAGVVQLYAQHASTAHLLGKGHLSRPVQMRWRSAGLEAIKAVASSDALGNLPGRQIHIIAPVVLENVWSDDEDFIELLLQRMQSEEKADAEKALRRRTSVATTGTADTGGASNPLAFSGTARDVDMAAEEDIGLLAMQCLKSIFEIPIRTQIYAATGELLKFILARAHQSETVLATNEKGFLHDRGWAVQIYSLVARWAPVQDRYTILVSALDTLTKLPIQEKNLDQHITLTSVIGSLLRSDVNLIGLSVMDVLWALVKHMNKLLQLSHEATGDDSVLDEKNEADGEPGSLSKRKELLNCLENCLGDLATHVYYADQVSDMIAAVIIRLKPGKSSSTSPTPQGEKTDGQEPSTEQSATDLADSQSQFDAFLSQRRGRISALKVIKAMLLVATPRTKLAGNRSSSRNRVPMQVWEGTQWLLRDVDGLVRKAYVDAFMTWLDRETTSADSRAHHEALIHPRAPFKDSREPAASAQRAVSNASNREHPVTVHRSQFLAWLHLAAYDNALQYVDFEADMVMLHALLTKLTFRLGVNAVQYGLPMIYRLQEDIQELEVPIQKVRVAAICHGYFWALAEKFEFEASPAGRAILNEIARRRDKGFWIDGINIPPPALGDIGTPGQVGSTREWDLAALESEELLPFDDRTTLVECVATGYGETARSPPSSPAASPGRTSTHVILGSTVSSAPPDQSGLELPSAFRSQMQADWSRENVVSALMAASKSESISGSKSGTIGTARNRLTVNIATASANGNTSLASRGSKRNLRPPVAAGQVHRVGSKSRLRKSSVRSETSPDRSAGHKAGVASVDQLKMILSGKATPRALGLSGMGDTDEDGEDESSDSMLSYDYSASELSSHGPAQGRKGPALASPESAAAMEAPDKEAATPSEEKDEVDVVPPVPPLPDMETLASRGSIQVGDRLTVKDVAKHSRGNMASRGGDSLRSLSVREKDEGPRATNLQELLMGIDSRSSEGGLGPVSKPPY